MEGDRSTWTELETEYVVGSARGAGWIIKLNVDGAVVSARDFCPPVGATVWLVVHPSEGEVIELSGQVTESHHHRFAVDFRRTSPEAIALVARSGESRK